MIYLNDELRYMCSKTCVERPLSKRPNIGFQDQLSLNAGHKHCRMLQGEHSAILSTFIKLPFVIKTMSIIEWPFYKDFTLHIPFKLLFSHKLLGQLNSNFFYKAFLE